ncbi:response regulator [Desulfuromonas thiophila]|jgi:two-component system chemotaxis response regulator CheY|uniref:Response regulator receiver protein n=1 Tax=Desulfuromonas thiophila TaxID=57664 RepID=A0A1G7EF36_9BACT|nr:response regulator [Desulfuromonas thiophila]SDE62264.1 response regulator receiver protein [Desulfuromonas thiophila]
MAKTVLAVDDSRSILQMVSMTLKGAGYQVVEAGNGQEALAQAQKQKFDLVLTDLNMPVMDGLTLVQKLRAAPAYKFTPILMLTTEAGESFKAKGKAAGLTGWLVKPFDPAKLLGVVKKVLG